MEATLKNELKKICSEVHFNEPMKKHTSFRTGGDAEAFIKPKSIEEFSKLLNFQNTNKIPTLVIGAGTNLLVRDSGIDGVVITTKDLKEKKILESGDDYTYVSVGAGVNTQSICTYAIENSLKGMNFATGIPGTIGGATWMNAGTATGSMEDVIHNVSFLTQGGEVVELKKEELKFFYRKLSLDHLEIYKNLIITGITLKLTGGEKESLKKEFKELLNRRKESQPLSYPSAGSFFKNPDEKPAGMLIDQCGLKGLKVGGAKVSEKHANFLVNEKDATTRDILELASIIKEKVFERFKIKLEEEVQIVGS